MLTQLRRHLIHLYCFLTSLILTVAIFVACFMNCSQRIVQKKSHYNDLINMAVHKLTTENVISHEWLTNFEFQNKILLHIEENGNPFIYRGSWSPDVSKAALIEHTQKLALKDGYDIHTKPFHLITEIQSPVYHYSYASSASNLSFANSYFIGTPTLSTVILIPTDNGYLSLTMVQILSTLKTSLIVTILIFVLLDLIGILALIFTSRFLVDKALKPVQENNKKQTEFIAAASHDLRTPLAIIQCNASALLLPDAKPDMIVPKIMQSCTSMSRLITDLLSLAASDSKTWKLNMETLDMEPFLIELYDSYSIYCQSRNHQLTLDFPEDALPAVKADKGRIHQVMGILIDNAISYSPEHSAISLRPYLKNETLIIEVADHGKGIIDSEKQLVFNRFYQSDKARGDQKHFGLGLSIAKELIELQKGSIHITDTVGGGATFVIEFPAII